MKYKVKGKVRKMGGSAYVTLSKIIRELSGININDDVTITADKGKIIIAKK